MTHIVLCATGHWSHLSPMLTVGRALALDGYDVIVLTGREVESDVREAGLRFRDFGPTGRGSTEADLADPERLARPGAQRFAWDMEYLMLGRMVGQHRGLQQLLGELDEVALVLFENMFFGAMPMLLGAPGPTAGAGAIGVGVQSLLLSSVDLAPFGAGLPPDASFTGRQRYAAEGAAFRQGLMGPAQQAFESALEETGATEPAPFFLDAPVLAPERFLQLSIEALSYPRSDLPPHVRFLGALPPPRSSAPTPDWWDGTWDQRPVIVLTQGTSANHDLSELIEPTLTALAGEDVTVVVATASDARPHQVPDNAFVERMLPFGELLPRADVLVCSGGASTVHQALAFGVPLVLAGEAEDKPENNARAAATGAAIDLRTGFPGPAAIREAVRRVLDVPDHRVAALRLSTEFRSRDALGAVSAVVAEVIGDRPRRHRLTSQGSLPGGRSPA